MNNNSVLQFIKSVSAGSRHSAVVSESNELFTWGEGEHGRLGIIVFLLYFYIDSIKV